MTLPHPDEIVIPSGRIFCDPERRSWLEARGYLAAEGPGEGAARDVFHRSSRRENARRTDGPEGQVVYDKRLRGRRDRNAAVNEWTVLRHALESGVRVAQPWAAGALRRGGKCEAFLVTAELAGSALPDLVQRQADRATATAIARAVGRAIASLHTAGITFPSAFAKHVLVDTDTQGRPIVGFLDLADARVRHPTRQERARDLGALAATLPRWPVSSSLRLVALRAYLDAADDPEWELRDAWRDVGRAASRRLRRRRFRRNLAAVPAAPLTLQSRGRGRWVVVEEARALADSGGFDALDPSGPQREHHGNRTVVRDTKDVVWRCQSILRTLHAFGVPAPVPIAVRLEGDRGLLLRRDRPPSHPVDTVSADAWVDLFRRLLRAGLVPRREFATVLRVGDDGRIHVTEPLLAQPQVVTPRVLRRIIKRARAAMVAAGVATTDVKTVVARLRAG